jgi:hypothetical protein
VLAAGPTSVKASGPVSEPYVWITAYSNPGIEAGAPLLESETSVTVSDGDEPLSIDVVNDGAWERVSDVIGGDRLSEQPMTMKIKQMGTMPVFMPVPGKSGEGALENDGGP